MTDKSMCCYCGFLFDSENSCIEHEAIEHEIDFCFHQNVLESEDCVECNPHLAMNETNFRGFIDADCRQYHLKMEDLYHCEICSPCWPYCKICCEFYPFSE